MTKDEIQIVNKTARHSGAVGQNALIPKIITGRYPYLGYKMLDFGSGPRCVQTFNLKELGYDVTPYDIGGNVRDGIHLVETEDDKGKYDLIFASNVLNVLPSEEAWVETLSKIDWFLGGDNAFAIMNFPKSPRKYSEMDEDKALKLLCKYFAQVMVENHSGTRVYYCYKNRSEL
jgi:hypothetical protein